MLDYGCGSGILAIAAAKLGAGRVVGIDIDPQALAREPRQCDARTASTRRSSRADALSASDAFDIVVANILANPLIVARAGARARVCDAAGASCCRASSMRRRTPSSRRTRGGLTSRVCERDDGWVALAGTRAGSARLTEARASHRASLDPAMAEEKYTRCPGCATVFRVTPAQLALRAGQVRCGHCRTVFDGIAQQISLAPPGRSARRAGADERRSARRR